MSPSLETPPRGNIPSPSGLPSTPRSPVSNINRIQPAASLRIACSTMGAVGGLVPRLRYTLKRSGRWFATR
jgi:hypothetical protein